ncbi:MAG: M28 family peptidase [Phormidesmis sp.]
MTKRGGLFFAIAAIAMSVIVWGNPITALRDALKTGFFPDIPAITSSADSLAATSLFMDEAQLMAHVNAIAKPRATPSQKNQTLAYITQQLTSYGVSFSKQPYAHPETGSAATGGINLVATLPGQDPNAGSFVLGAHYDTPPNSPGADDNASAIAALLETARLLSTITQPATDSGTNSTTDRATAQTPAALPFPHGLTLVFFDQEERQPDGSGLLGSLAFTAEPTNLSKVKGAIVLDMIGYACHTEGCQRYPQGLPLPAQTLPKTGDFLAVLGLSDHTDLIGAFMGSAQSAGPLVMSLPVPKTAISLFPDLLRSDHAPFWEKDTPAVFVTDTANFRNENYHTELDTPETLDFAFLRGSAQHVFNATVALLDQDP